MITLKINVTKIPRESIFQGQNGKYVDLVIWENREPDQYGNTHSVTLDQTKEQRESGEKKVYVGNGIEREKRGNDMQKPFQKRRQPPPQDQGGGEDWGPDSEEIPF